ncbi:MAG TPA: hypothetical protein PKC72_13775 [Chitinophagaceae bacterium]|nr:hypothetical protein [Chitinophagaceae bacterium]
MRNLFYAALLLSVICSCNDNASKKKDTKDSAVVMDDPKIETIDKNALLKNTTTDILTSIKNKKYAALADYIHPEAGIRFSPYAFVDTVHDVVMSPAKFTEELNKNPQQKILWGEYDGTGDPISLSLNEFMQKFVYPADFLSPENFKVNEFIGSGNTINNLKDVYKDCDFTESHFSGFEKKYDGMDWRSLRLVFKMKDGKYYLVGIVSDQWTI